MIESLHPFAIGVAVACLPVATILVSAGVDYVSHRNHEQQASITAPAERGRLAPAARRRGGAKAVPASTQLPATDRTS